VSGSRTGVLFAGLLLGGCLVGCGGSSANGSFTPGPLPHGADWTGVYFSDWGRMELTRTGDSVVGTFTSDTKRGHLSGTVNGDILHFTWSQEDNTIIGRPRTITGSGVFQYYIEDDEHHLRGTWGYEGAVEGGGTWDAVRGRGRPASRTQALPSTEDQNPPDESGGEEQPDDQQAPAQGQSSPDALDNL
jgi:hypothetical protein